MPELAFTRSNVRAGDKAVAVHEASPEEHQQLQEARKAQKVRAKQRRAQRHAEKQAAREAAADQVTA